MIEVSISGLRRDRRVGRRGRFAARSTLDGSTDARIGTAATNVPGHRAVDVGVARFRIGCEQRVRAHDLPRLAIAALRHIQFEPSLLDLLACGGTADRFDRGDALTCCSRDRRNAERTGLPSRWIVQAPHKAVPQPNFVPVMASTSRNTHNRGACRRKPPPGGPFRLR